jgi:lycopene cyclase domain-containing protein
MVAFARHGTGPVAVARAYGSQVHPVFMLPPVAASLFGAVLAGAPVTGGGPGVVAHAGAVFAAVYTAHVKDGYVDFHRRGEDDDHPLTARGCRVGLVASTALFACCLVGVWTFGGPLAAALTAPTWAIGYLHAPQLDTNPVTTTAGYPTGIALALLGGYATVAGGLGAAALVLAGVLLSVLAGVKVIDDETDYEYDRSIGKRTVAVALGPRRARRLAAALMGVGGFGVLAGAVTGHLPPASPAAVVVFGAVAVIAHRAEPRVATMLLVRGAYLLFAVLVVAVAFRPLSGVALPDIGVLGPYTYLATEVAFGAVAVALLVRANALGRALRTAAVLYPLAYLWDWYTLEVGVFEIPLRTGVELLGIPLEEHLFMLVVPCLVVGLHETLHGAPEGEG